MPTRCWALGLEGCGGGPSREHLLSKSHFDNNSITLQGLPWCKDAAKTIGLGSLVSKNLCRNHNTALSETDAEAARLLDVLRFVLKREADAVNKPRRVFEIHGRLIERWLLKTTFNLAMQEDDQGPGLFSQGQANQRLVRIAFGLETFGPGEGLHWVAAEGEQLGALGSLHFETMVRKADDAIVAAFLRFHGHRLLLALDEAPAINDAIAPVRLLEFRHVDVDIGSIGRAGESGLSVPRAAGWSSPGSHFRFVSDFEGRSMTNGQDRVSLSESPGRVTVPVARLATTERRSPGSRTGDERTGLVLEAGARVVAASASRSASFERGRHRPRHEPPSSPLGVVVRYVNNLREALGRFLEYGFVPLDNGAVERLHVRAALIHKNYQFAGADAGGDRAAIAFTIFGSCRLAGVDPFRYLAEVLPRLTGRIRLVRLHCRFAGMLHADQQHRQAADAARLDLGGSRPRRTRPKCRCGLVVKLPAPGLCPASPRTDTLHRRFGTRLCSHSYQPSSVKTHRAPSNHRTPAGRLGRHPQPAYGTRRIDKGERG
jgi:hypothetical protein